MAHGLSSAHELPSPWLGLHNKKKISLLTQGKLFFTLKEKTQQPNISQNNRLAGLLMETTSSNPDQLFVVIIQLIRNSCQVPFFI